MIFWVLQSEGGASAAELERVTADLELTKDKLKDAIQANVDLHRLVRHGTLGLSVFVCVCVLGGCLCGECDPRCQFVHYGDR